MSLLVNESYANPATPLWVSSNGGSINGDLTVTGTVTADNGMVAPSLVVVDTGGFGDLILAYDSTVNGNGLIQCRLGKSILLGAAANNANSFFTPSASGANTDVLRIRGSVICNPIQVITANKTISPIPPAPSFFSVDNGVATVNGNEYDVQVRGFLTLNAGVPAADDVINVTVSVGGVVPTSSYTLQVLPGQASTGLGLGPFGVGVYGYNIRSRMICSGNDSVRVSVEAVLGVGSTADYAASLNQLDVTLVGLSTP